MLRLRHGVPGARHEEHGSRDPREVGRPLALRPSRCIERIREKHEAVRVDQGFGRGQRRHAPPHGAAGGDPRHALHLRAGGRNRPRPPPRSRAARAPVRGLSPRFGVGEVEPEDGKARAPPGRRPGPPDRGARRGCPRHGRAPSPSGPAPGADPRTDAPRLGGSRRCRSGVRAHSDIIPPWT